MRSPRGIVARIATSIRPPSPTLRGFLLATLISSIGTSMYTTVAIVFFVRSLRLSAGFVGVGLTIATAFGIVVSLPAGRLADRYGAKPVLVVIFVMQAALFALFPLVSGRVAFLIAVVLVATTANASYPVSQVLLADLVAGGPRVKAAAYNRSILNVGMSLGALIAAAALVADSRLGYDLMLLGNAASFVGAAVLVGRVTVPARVQTSVEPKSGSVSESGSAMPGRHPLRQPRFVAAALICGVLYLSANILEVGLPLQVIQHTSAPRWIIAALLLLNTVLAVTFQVRASAGSETIPGAARANRLAGIVLLGACLLFPAAAGRGAAVAVIVLIAATILLTAGELFSSAGSWGLSYGLAPLAEQGKYLASFGMVTRLVDVFGPVLAVTIVGVGLVGWLAIGAAFLGVGLLAPLVSGTGQESASVPAS